MTSGEPSAGPALPGPPQFNAIPVWDSVKAAFAAVQGDLESFFVAARIWVLVLGVLGGATLSLAAGAEPGGASGFAFAVAIVRIVGTAAFLVAWHRHVLLAETIAPMGAVKIGRREGRFVLYELVPAVLIALVFLVSEILALPVAAFAVAAIAVFAVSVRWLLFAPLAALDVPGNLLAHSWNLSRGNGLRLFGGFCVITILIFIPLMILQVLYLGFAGGQVSPNLILNLIYSLASETLNFAVLAWCAGFLCHSFAVIMQRTLPLDPHDKGIFPGGPAAQS